MYRQNLAGHFQRIKFPKEGKGRKYKKTMELYRKWGEICQSEMRGKGAACPRAGSQAREAESTFISHKVHCGQRRQCGRVS